MLAKSLLTKHFWRWDLETQKHNRNTRTCQRTTKPRPWKTSHGTATWKHVGVCTCVCVCMTNGFHYSTLNPNSKNELAAFGCSSSSPRGRLKHHSRPQADRPRGPSVPWYFQTFKLFKLSNISKCQTFKLSLSKFETVVQTSTNAMFSNFDRLKIWEFEKCGVWKFESLRDWKPSKLSILKSNFQVFTMFKLSNFENLKRSNFQSLTPVNV